MSAILVTTSGQLPVHRRRKHQLNLLEYAVLLALVALSGVGLVMFVGVSSMPNHVQTPADAHPSGAVTPTVPAAPRCASVYADGYALGAGHGFECYSPALGHGYDVP